MISSHLVNHHLPCWSHPVMLAALAVLPCLPSFTQAQDRESGTPPVDFRFSTVDVELVPVELADVDGDPLSNRVVVEYPVPNVEGSFWRFAVTFPGQTDRRTYESYRSKLGVVVLAFDRESGKLAWSSEIELPVDGKAPAGQRLLLHTGGGAVTIAAVSEDKSLTIQELDAETGKVTSECQLARPGVPDAERGAMGRRLEALQDQLQRLIDEEKRRVGEDGLRAPQRDWVLRQAKQLGDALVIDSGAIGVRPLTVETAGTVWRLINREAPIESVRIVRESGIDRIIIEGKAPKHRRIILEVSPKSDEADPKENGKEGTPGTPPGGISPDGDSGASTPPTATDSLVQKAAQYLSRQRRVTPVDGFDYSTEIEPSEVPRVQGDNPGQARQPIGSELRRAWLDAKGAVPTENQVALAALCWAAKENMRDKPFTSWLSDKPIQVDWPLNDHFERFASLDLFGVLPEGITDCHLRQAWLDLYGLPLTSKAKEDAALNWIKLRQS